MTVQEYAARQTVRMAEALSHFIQTTPVDRLDWHAETQDGGSARSALEQAGECIQVNRLMAALLRGEEVPASNALAPEIGEEAQAQLMASARELAAALMKMTDADLERIYAHPRGPMLGQNMILMAYRNMAYHAGQINFIQILYGDKEFHLPPNWR